MFVSCYGIIVFVFHYDEHTEAGQELLCLVSFASEICLRSIQDCACQNESTLSKPSDIPMFNRHREIADVMILRYHFV